MLLNAPAWAVNPLIAVFMALNRDIGTLLSLASVRVVRAKATATTTGTMTAEIMPRPA
ncbi:hypothetical protein Asru_0689_01 [Acidisphaera rubrifaciens HS-AP3]|uniref:Uncharacterized protein n=1 Tax=Acidisphaera rubrifaciens HS-AP3 TaxID=1231350 RepID=A0A0D6PAJ1_9PROT|nr:hypothetical protein Asru_0689_01 [Acidisphaera rubrifaciens HS-AP3]